MSPASLCHGRARQNSGTGPYGGCRRVLWVPGLWGQYSGTIRFIEKPGVQDVVVAMWQNVVLYPEVKIQVRDLVRVVGFVTPLWPTGVGTKGKFVLSSPRRINGHRRPVPGAPSCGTPR